MIKDTIKALLEQRSQVEELDDKITDLFEDKLSLLCEHHIPPKDPTGEEEFGSIHWCKHPKGTICCIDECQLYGD